MYSGCYPLANLLSLYFFTYVRLVAGVWESERHGCLGPQLRAEGDRDRAQTRRVRESRSEEPA